jgi:hypothetical protein
VDHSLGRFEIYDSRMDVVRRGGKHGSRMYYYHCNGKWLMDFHGSLLIFLFYLEEYRENKSYYDYIKKIVFIY